MNDLLILCRLDSLIRLYDAEVLNMSTCGMCHVIHLLRVAKVKDKSINLKSRKKIILTKLEIAFLPGLNYI